MRRDVRMVQRGERLRFAREPRQAIGVVRERSGRTLIATSRSSFVSRARKTCAHAAFANVRGDFVDAETRAGSEAHCFTGAIARR